MVQSVKKKKMLHHQLLEMLIRQQLCSANKQVHMFELILYLLLLLYLFIIILFCTIRIKNGKMSGCCACLQDTS